MKRNLNMSKNIFGLLMLFLLSLPMLGHANETSPAPVAQTGAAEEQGSARIMQAFSNDKSEKSELVAIEDKTKRLVMFFMGVPLLLLILATVSLGVAMVMYGKRVFVPHMVCAGLSLTLALGHAVVGIVWFYPF
jgi:hypothetical protein